MIIRPTKQTIIWWKTLDLIQKTELKRSNSIIYSKFVIKFRLKKLDDQLDIFERKYEKKSNPKMFI